MTTLLHAALMLVTLSALATTANAAESAKQPNIIVIVADDLGYADVGFQGCKDIPTPHLDSLARGGVICTNGYVSHPFCSPTRAGLLTGRYQQRFGHENNPKWEPQNAEVGLPLEQKTLADTLKKSGYTTGMVGKWHLGAHASYHPNRRGFDSYYGVLGGGHQYLNHNTFKTDPEKAKQEYLIPLVRNETPVEESDYLTDVFSREAVAFVEANKAKPFFLYYTFNAPHTPLQATEKYLERVKEIKDEKLRTYGAMICSLDDAVGALMAKLKEHQIADNTLIFFFSDNGGPVGVTNCRNTPLRGAKGQVYEGGIRVPFVVSWPAKLKPGKFDLPVSSLDVFPTALVAAGNPNASPAKLDGVDLMPHLINHDKSELANRPLFWRTGGGQSYALRVGNRKLVKTGKNPAELYDLATDIAEAKNLAEQQPRDVAALQKRLDAWNSELIPPKWQNPQPAKKNNVSVSK